MFTAHKLQTVSNVVKFARSAKPLRPFCLLFIGDEVVPYVYGERSTHVLSSAGYRNLAFKKYDGYPSFSFFFLCKTVVFMV